MCELYKMFKKLCKSIFTLNCNICIIILRFNKIKLSEINVGQSRAYLFNLFLLK